MQKKIRDAEMEWIPYILIVGQKEVDSDMFMVRDRKVGRNRKMKLEELIDEVEVGHKPFRPLPLPQHLSKRPRFFG